MQKDSIYALLILFIWIFFYNIFDLSNIFSVSIFYFISIIIILLLLFFFISKKFKYFWKNIDIFRLDCLIMLLISLILWFFYCFKELSIIDLISIFWLSQNVELCIIIDSNYLFFLFCSWIAISIMFYILWLFFLVLLLPEYDN